MPDFNDIYGNESVKRKLENANAYNRVAHAYMIWGEAGLGKKMMAKAFAKTIQCEVGGQAPCGICTSCKQVENENHPDVIYVRHEKPTVFSVEDIRQGLNRSIVIKPYKSEKKIYILEDGELLNVQAQNAMLKTIEEPPGYAVIIIITNNREVFLPTILSRCVELNVLPVSEEEVLKCVKERGFQIEKKERELLYYAGGNIGKAIEFLTDEKAQNLLQDVKEVLYGLPFANSGEIKGYVDRLMAYKDRIPMILEQIRLWFKNVYSCKMGAYEGEAGELKKQAELYQYEDLPVIMEEIDRLHERLKVNVNAELSLEVFLLSIRPGCGLTNLSN